MKSRSYEDRLRKLGLLTLKFNHIRGDITELYKLTHDIGDPEVSPALNFNKVIIRKHWFRLIKTRLNNVEAVFFFS